MIKWNQKYIFCDLQITNFPLDAHWLDAQMFQLIPYVFVHSLEFDPSWMKKKTLYFFIKILFVWKLHFMAIFLSYSCQRSHIGFYIYTYIYKNSCLTISCIPGLSVKWIEKIHFCIYACYALQKLPKHRVLDTGPVWCHQGYWYLSQPMFFNLLLIASTYTYIRYIHLHVTFFTEANCFLYSELMERNIQGD